MYNLIGSPLVEKGLLFLLLYASKSIPALNTLGETLMRISKLRKRQFSENTWTAEKALDRVGALNRISIP